VEALVHFVEALVDRGKANIDGIEALVEAVELRGDELHQLLVLTLGHLASGSTPLCYALARTPDKVEQAVPTGHGRMGRLGAGRISTVWP